MAGACHHLRPALVFIDDRLSALEAGAFRSLRSLRSRSLRVIKVFGNTKYLSNVNTKVLNDP